MGEIKIPYTDKPFKVFDSLCRFVKKYNGISKNEVLVPNVLYPLPLDFIKIDDKCTCTDLYAYVNNQHYFHFLMFRNHEYMFEDRLILDYIVTDIYLNKKGVITKSSERTFFDDCILEEYLYTNWVIYEK